MGDIIDAWREGLGRGTRTGQGQGERRKPEVLYHIRQSGVITYPIV